jgi:hypothetical protein
MITVVHTHMHSACTFNLQIIDPYIDRVILYNAHAAYTASNKYRIYVPPIRNAKEDVTSKAQVVGHAGSGI